MAKNVWIDLQVVMDMNDNDNTTVFQSGFNCSLDGRDNPGRLGRYGSQTVFSEAGTSSLKLLYACVNLVTHSSLHILR